MDYVNIGISAFLMAIMVIKLFGDFHMGKGTSKERHQFTNMLFSNTIMLAAVLVAKIVVCVVQDEKLLTLLLQIAYSMYFVGFYILLGFYSIYVTYYISRKSGKKLEIRGFIMPLIIIYSVFWVISLFKGVVVTYEGHTFEKGALYWRVCDRL